MEINQEKCIACENCIPYCPMSAIIRREDKVEVDYDECVECNICTHADVCPTDALEKDPLDDEMRVIRNAFSDPLVSHSSTSVPGRGTEEMKTNDVTARFKPGYAGIAIEMGRPATGTRFRDVEKVAKACARHGVTFEKENPVTSMMANKDSGKLREDVLDEKVLSAIIEFIIDIDKVRDVLEDVKKVSQEIDTVFSLDLASKVADDGSIPTEKIARDLGMNPKPNGKINVGLGRPRAI